jgi:hypothetical protein
METSLHKDLKRHYAGRDGKVEIAVDSYRIDVVKCGRLIEIQHGSLSAIRDKVRSLSANHRLTVVKPIVRRKYLIQQDRRGGTVLSRRLSPKQGQVLDIFHDLVYFRHVLPHPNIRLEIPIVTIEEWRHPGHGRRRRWRQRDFQVEDQKLLEIEDIHRLNHTRDLLELLPSGLPYPFSTEQLSQLLQIGRWFSQRIMYCLREMRLADVVGKHGNCLLYTLHAQGNNRPVRRHRSAHGARM